MKQAKEFATETNRPYDLSFAWFGDGFVKLQQRDGEAAANAFRESMALAEAREAADENSPPRSREGWLQERARVAVPRAQAGLGHALLVDGHLEAATRWLSQAREISREHNRYMVHIWAASGLAFAHFGAGQDELALRFAQEAVDMGLQFGFYGFHVQALRARGLIRASSPATAAAGVEDLVTALSAAARMEMRTQVAHCHASFVLARTSDMTFHVDEAQRLYEKLNMRAWWEHLLKAAKRGDRVYC